MSKGITCEHIRSLRQEIAKHKVPYLTRYLENVESAVVLGQCFPYHSLTIFLNQLMTQEIESGRIHVATVIAVAISSVEEMEKEAG